jgi:hypothetical protein
MVDLKPYFFEFTLGTTTKLLFGEDLTTLPQENRDAFRDAFDYVSWTCGIRTRLADLAPLYNTVKFRKACKVVKKVAEHFLDRALKYEEEFGEDAAFKKYAFIMELWAEMGRHSACQRSTTTLPTSWARHNSLFAKLDILPPRAKPRNPPATQDEVSKIPKNVDITRKLIQLLPFLRCCLNETLRLYLQLPLNLRFATKNTVLPCGGGSDGLAPVLIPKGSAVGWSAYHLHRNTYLYGLDAHLYNPQRWESGELLKRARPGSGFLDFGGGARVCLGSMLLALHLSMVLYPANVTQKTSLSWKLVMPSSESCRNTRG